MSRNIQPAYATLSINGATLRGRILVSGRRQILQKTENTTRKTFEFYLIDFGEACVPVELWLVADDDRPAGQGCDEVPAWR